MSASAALSTSAVTHLDREQMVGVLTSLAMVWTARKSPGELAAKPASMTSTRRRSNCLAISTFSSRVMAAPAACSPSRSVVSKIITLSSGILGHSFVSSQCAGELCLRIVRETIPAKDARVFAG